MQFKDLIIKAAEVKAVYDQYNELTAGKPWSRENVAEGLIGDVGDLMKLVMAKEGLRQMDGVDEKLAHELADCLWSIIVLADLYNVDLENSFVETMNKLDADVKSRIASLLAGREAPPFSEGR